MHRRGRSARRRLAAERGFTLIELLMASWLMAVALLALIGALDGSRSAVTRAEVLETAAHQAEGEMERILALDYSAIALRAAPQHSSDANDPRYYVTGGSYQWDQGPTGPRTGDLVIDAAGALDPPAISWTDGQSRFSGQIHRFVTWTGDLCSSCAGLQRAKRITVAVTVDNSRWRRKPLLIGSIKIDPSSTG
jgi:prepilin-type N-terminal cleavage/methylation domain-containing protein